MISLKINTEAFVAMESKVRQAALDILSNKDLKQEVGDFAVGRVKYQARAGKPFNATETFPDLKSSTIRHRKYLGKYNATHGTFDPEFSNLTITGDLIESLISLDEGDAQLRIAFSGMHKVYVGAKGQRISKPIMNETLARYLSQKGFNVFDKTLANKQQFVNRIKTICLGYIRRGLKVRSKLAQG